MGLAPPRVEVFCELLVAGMAFVADIVGRGGIEVDNMLGISVLYRTKEWINHLFLHCEITSQIRSLFIGRCGLHWCIPGVLSDQVEA